MTNENAFRAKNAPMTREKMQTEALIIENLLEAAMAMQGDDDREDALTMIEMAHDRAGRLNNALDQVNNPEMGR